MAGGDARRLVRVCAPLPEAPPTLASGVVTAKLCVVFVAAALAWGLKHHYSVADADDLWWVLTPTAALVEAITGAVFTATPGEGYFSRERLFLIEKSCAGINFMVAAFGMLMLALVHRVGSAISAARVLGV